MQDDVPDYVKDYRGKDPKIVTFDSGEMVVVFRPRDTNVLDWEYYGWKSSVEEGFAGQVMENDAIKTLTAIKDTVKAYPEGSFLVMPAEEAVRKACQLRDDDVVTMTIPPGDDDHLKKERIMTVYRLVYSQKERWVRLCSGYSARFNMIMEGEANRVRRAAHSDGFEKDILGIRDVIASHLLISRMRTVRVSWMDAVFRAPPDLEQFPGAQVVLSDEGRKRARLGAGAGAGGGGGGGGYGAGAGAGGLTPLRSSAFINAGRIQKCMILAGRPRCFRPKK
jgi:hypothetical protein